MTSQNTQSLDERETPKPQAGEWTLTAPDGRTWKADSPLKTVGAEQRERVPAKVAVERIFAACDDQSQAAQAMGKIASQWDGCFCDIASVGSVDIGAAIRNDWHQYNHLTTAATPATAAQGEPEPSGVVEAGTVGVLTNDNVIDLVKEAGLDWHAGFDLNEENRYGTLVGLAFNLGKSLAATSAKPADGVKDPFVIYLDADPIDVGQVYRAKGFQFLPPNPTMSGAEIRSCGWKKNNYQMYIDVTPMVPVGDTEAIALVDGMKFFCIPPATW